MLNYSKYLLITTCFTGVLYAANDAGPTADTLDTAIANTITTTDKTVKFTQDVSLVSPNDGGGAAQVRALNSNHDFTFAGQTITVNGNNHKLNGNGNTRGFFVGGDSSSSTGSVTINNLIFNSCQAHGGNGGAGGLGAGGGLFVGANTKVILKSPSFINCSAVGGNGNTGTPSFDGGGGMRGNSGGGGAGGFGGNGNYSGGGASGFNDGNAGGSTSPGLDFDGDGSAGASGCGGQMTPLININGGFGGGGAQTDDGGGTGGFGGGGGQAVKRGNAGSGGFGGGGGASIAIAASGGFGAGGGSSGDSPGSGGFGGGDGTTTPEGGNGAGFGGAIFIQMGGDLTIENSVKFSGNSATAGTGGNPNTDSDAGMGALGQDIFMMSGSQLTFDLTSNVSIPSPIQSNQGNNIPDPSSPTTTGGLTKKGSALLTLNGANTYTGTTNVAEGSLRINDSVVSNITVGHKGTLLGTFSVNQDITTTNGGNLTNSGIVSPGGKRVGTITLAGDFTQTATGKLVMDIEPNGKHDLLFLTTGTAHLDGTLQVVINKGKYKPGTKYELINAPTNGTKFAKVIKTGPAAKTVNIKVNYSSVIVTIVKPKKPKPFELKHIQSGVPSAVAACVKTATITPHSDFATVKKALDGLNDSAVNDALYELSPVNYGNIEWINARNNSYIADMLSQHMFQLCCSPRNCDPCTCTCNASFWIEGFGNFMDNTKRFNNLSKFDANAGGVLTGIDWCFGPELYFGGSFGYTHTGFHWKDKGHGDINSYWGALYGSWSYCDCFTVDLSAIGGGSDHETHRKMDFSTIDRSAKADFWGYFFTGHLGVQADWCWCYTSFEPFALVDYHYFQRNGFHEKGADSLDLDVKSKTQHILRGEAGLKACWTWVCQCSCFSPYLGLSWVGEFPLNKSKQKAHFTDESCVIDVKSYSDSVQLASPQAGIKWTWNDGFSFILGYKGLYNSKTRIDQVEGRLEWIF